MCGSVRGVWLWLREQELKFPLQPTAYLRGGEITWVEPTYHAVHNVLTHPAYAGAYVFAPAPPRRSRGGGAGGSYRDWGFAMYRASHDDYEDSYLPTGFMGGSAEDALDTACGLYLADPTAWTWNPRRTYDRDHQ